MAQIDIPLVHAQFAQTSRRDNWWIPPLAVFIGLSTFTVYCAWAALQGQHYRFGPYLSPFYSPELFGDPTRSWFGLRPEFPAWVTAAMLILWAPGGFRVTSYTAALEMNPIDQGDRIPELRKHYGIGLCEVTKCCTKVCPENTSISDNGIIPLKKRVVDRLRSLNETVSRVWLRRALGGAYAI